MNNHPENEEFEIIKAIAWKNPIVAQMLIRYKKGECNWEQALVAMVAGLNKVNEDMKNMNIELLAKAPIPWISKDDFSQQ